MGRTLKDLINRGGSLKEQVLVNGFEAFQEWREDCLSFIEAYCCRFASEIETPMHIERGIRFLESSFAPDD